MQHESNALVHETKHCSSYNKLHTNNKVSAGLMKVNLILKDLKTMKGTQYVNMFSKCKWVIDEKGFSSIKQQKSKTAFFFFSYNRMCPV